MSKNYIERNTYSELLELDLQEVVSENIKRCVVESGFTAEQLSYRTNLSVATINRLKAGQNLSIRGICALADALNKDWRVFFAYGEDIIPLAPQAFVAEWTETVKKMAKSLGL